MKCLRCGATWEVAPHFKYPPKCPFCGTVLSGHDLDGAEVLKNIIRDYGLDVLRDRKRLTGLLGDLLQHRPRELFALRIAAGEGIGDYFFKALSTDEAIRNNQLNIAHRFLICELGMTEERAKLILNSFGRTRRL